MKKLFTLLFILLLQQTTKAQIQQVQPYGEVSVSDLQLTDCDFEKGANAMVLFDKADIKTSPDSIVIRRHKRIKMFNGYDKNLANIRLSFYSKSDLENVSNIEAQTVRLENNTIVITKIDPKLIYTEIIDKNSKAIVFTFPEVKPGCIIEYKYTWKTISPRNFSPWFFQGTIPARYSEVTINEDAYNTFDIIDRGKQPYVRDSTENVGKNSVRFVLAKANVHSIIAEPFVDPANINIQCLFFQKHFTESWPQIAEYLVANDDFGGQLDVNFPNQDELLNKARSLKTDDEKIAYIFYEVKKNIKWNKIDTWYTDKGVRSTWNKKIGNSTEINLTVYNLLQKLNIKAYPMVISTANNGALLPIHASYRDINKTVVFIPTADSTQHYVLDATGKYNLYNELPADLLNTYGLIIDKKAAKYKKDRFVYLKNEALIWQKIYIEADIKPDSKVTGNINMRNYSYSSSVYRELYDKLGDSKYKDFLRGDDERMKITGLNFENMGVDSLPLVQKIDFDLQLLSTDDQYIYFNPNLFSPLRKNPFFSEQRFSDINFGNCNAYNIDALYKVPEGYKIDVLPVNIVLYMHDKSISFKRVIGENNGKIQLHYTIIYKRINYKVDEYPSLRDFYKKMYDMLNEPVVLKKGS